MKRSLCINPLFALVSSVNCLYITNEEVFSISSMKIGRRLRVSESRVLRRVFGPKTDEVTGEWRKLHNELSDLYSLPNIVQVVKIEKNEMGRACSAYGGGERCAQGSGGETCGKETIGETQT